MYGIPVVGFIVSSVVVNLVTKKGKRWTRASVLTSFPIAATAFLFYGPMIPLSEWLASSLWLVVLSQLLLGLSMAPQHLGALMTGMADLTSTGLHEDSAVNGAFAAAFLTAYAVGLVCWC